MGIETIIGVDAEGGDTLESLDTQGRIIKQSVPQRIFPAVRTLANKYRDTRFVLAGNADAMRDYFGVILPKNIEILSCRERHGAYTLAELLRKGTIHGLYTMGNTISVDAAVAKVGFAPELADFLPEPPVPPLLAELPKSPWSKCSKTWYVLDAGAQSEHMDIHEYVWLAHLGQAYASVMGRPIPRLGLKNIGREPNKGSKLLQAVFKTFQKLDAQNVIRFAGNVESYTCAYGWEKGTVQPSREIDVVVTSGERGNDTLKDLATGAALVGDFIAYKIRHAGLFDKVAGLKLRRLFKGIKQDIRQYGGAVFLGTNIIKDHGTTEYPIYGLEKCITHVKNNVLTRFREELHRSAPVFKTAYQGILSETKA